MLRSLHILFLLLIVLSETGQSLSQSTNPQIDSLFSLLNKDKPDTNKVIHLNKLCVGYQSIGNYDTALRYGNAALQLARQLPSRLGNGLGWSQGVANAYNNIGTIYYYQGDYNMALENLFAALKIREETGDREGIAASYTNIGSIYYMQGNYDKALEKHLASLKITQELLLITQSPDKYRKLRGSIAASYSNIGTIYTEQGNFQSNKIIQQEQYNNALENYFAALKILIETGNKHNIAVLYNNIGLIYDGQGNYAKALEKHLAALQIREEIGDKHGIADSYNNIGKIYHEQADRKQGPDNTAYREQLYQRSLKNYFPSLKMYEEIGNKQGIAFSCNNIGNIYLALKQFAQAVKYCNRAAEIAKEIGSKEDIKESYKNISGIYEQLNDYKNAYHYYQLYSRINDSIFNEASNKQIAEMQTKYESGKKEKENILLQQKNQIQQLEIERQKVERNIQIFVFIGSIVFILIISFLMYNRYRFKQKTAMEAEINRQQKLRFKEVMDAEEKERRRIAQELHDGLGQLLSTVKLNVSATEHLIDDANKTPFLNSLSLLDTACDEVRTISHNMMPSVLIRIGLLAALRELIRKINESRQIAVNMEVNFTERLEEYAEVAVYRIVQEVLNNSIKYAHAKMIAVRLNKQKNNFLMEISDDGIGFDTSLIEKGEGIGWKNIYSRAAMLNGTVNIVSAPSAGMRLKIIFPELFSEA